MVLLGIDITKLGLFPQKHINHAVAFAKFYINLGYLTEINQLVLIAQYQSKQLVHSSRLNKPSEWT